jgi:outer membrane protein TolC
VLGIEDVLKRATESSPALRAGALQVLQNRYLEKSTLNLPNPALIVESPTGNFYTFGVQQSFNFPTIYGKQKKLAQQQTLLSERNQAIAQNDLRLQVWLLYLNIQYLQERTKLWNRQTETYARIAATAERSFAAGQINFLESTYSTTRYDETQRQFVQLQEELNAYKRQLALLTGSDLGFTVTPLAETPTLLTADNLGTDSVAFNQSANLQAAQQEIVVAEQSLRVEKDRALPGFTIGYINQGERNSPFENRFNVGVTVPLWYGQYKSRTNAAQTAIDAARQNLLATQQELMLEKQQALGNYYKFQKTLDYYNQKGLRQADTIIETANRLFQSGQTDYITNLRAVNDAYDIRLRYLDNLRAWHEAAILLNYLNGQL